MVKIDVKDKKILYELVNNSRQPLSIIGKNVGLSREVVGYRINRMEKEGVIINYPALIYCGNIGLSMARFYFNFQFMNPKTKQELLDFFKKSEIVTMVAELSGNYDLQVNLYTSSIYNNEIGLKFNKFYDELQKKYRRYFDEQIGTIFTGSNTFDLAFLLDDKDAKPLHIAPNRGMQFEIDELDLNILRKLAKNARIPTAQLANELNTTVTTVNKRIKRLEEKHLFMKFWANIDWTKIGYRQYDIEINLKDYSKKNDIINYIRKNQHILFIMHSVGRGVDLDFEFILRDITHLQDIITDLSDKFPESIKNFRYFSTEKVHKWNHITF
jgi:DNA-binding Lrp family transcriptional regulator